MRSSIALRVSVTYALLVLLTVSILLVMIFENQLDLIARNAMLQSRLLGRRLGSSLVDGDLSQLDQDLIEALGIARLVVYDESGARISTILETEPTIATEVEEAEVLRNIGMALARRDFEYRSFYHDLDYENRIVSLYVPFISQSGRAHVVRADVPLLEIDTSLSSLYRQAVVIVILVFLLHAAWAIYIYRTIVRPMKRILAATGQVSRGNFEIRVPVVERNELGRLASAFNEMSVALSRIRDEALQSNPLTGLPGNPAIVAEIDRRLGGKVAVMYADLDNFKAYNDHYGFSRGDDALLYTRDSLVDAATGYPDAFLGHEGGDDFVVVVAADQAESLARAIVERFDRDRRSLFQDGDWRRGYFAGHDRNGNEAVFPLLSISVAVVTNDERRIDGAGKLIAVIAEVKRRAKQREGSTYVIDRGGDGERS